MSATCVSMQRREPWSALDQVLREDAAAARRRLATAIGEPEVFAHLSDLDVACLYESGPSDLADAMYCELHQRGLTPWRITMAPALDVSMAVEP